MVTFIHLVYEEESFHHFLSVFSWSRNRWCLLLSPTSQESLGWITLTPSSPMSPFNSPPTMSESQLKSLFHCNGKKHNRSSPGSFAARWSRRSTSLSSRASSTSTRSSCRQRSACEELDINANTNRTHKQTYIRTYTYSYTLMHAWHGVAASPSRTVTRRRDDIDMFWGQLVHSRALSCQNHSHTQPFITT